MRFNLLLPLVAAVAISACSSDDNPLNQIFGEFRVANAIADSAPIDAEIVGAPTDINDIEFGTASGLREVPEGEYRVTLRSTINSSTVQFSEDSVDVNDDDMTTVYAIGDLSQSTQDIFVVTAPDTDVPSNQSEAQFVHVASETPQALDVYLTGLNADLLSATPTTTLNYPGKNTQAFYAPGDYRIRVTPQGNKATVLFDSGNAEAVDLPGETTQQFALIDNTNNAINSPLTVLVLKGTGESFRINHLGL
jgi:hypothetical protein